MTALADAVLPLVRTRADVWRWDIANACGDRMHEAVAILRQATEHDDPAEARFPRPTAQHLRSRLDQPS
ncbi:MULTISPECIES: hypothetical protein [unclassified Mycobacterium]|uniref:hypothetical protein n=1 Tax=unclassified Mycobacterium TaxID=2642494 RepID=UPI0029C76DE0|nr:MULTISPECIES: hypothetical protein [unclassified Mycobacterium]